jgi:hypothetical protein
MVCLVGHGDATKTTVLDAIEFVIGARYGRTVTETDFHQLDTSRPIRIVATVGELPDVLLADNKFGGMLRGWDPNASELHDEPTDELERVITIVVEVDDGMEPVWKVITDRHPDGRSLQVRDRELLGVARIGSEVDKHLTWTRGSALTRATEGIGGVKRVLTEAHQQTRKVIDDAELADLRKAAETAQEAATAMGAIVNDEYRPSLGGLPSLTGYGFLTLHDGNAPLLSAGLGTRRLVAMGLQARTIPEGGIVLVDEIENGLEPHRLRHVLKALRSNSDRGQVLFSSHSPVTLVELAATEVSWVKCLEGNTVITPVPPELQDVLRAVPEAFLTHRVLFGEGKTEVGLCRGLEELWASQVGEPLTHVGALVVDGHGGPGAKSRAIKLAAIGITTALLVDSDDSQLTFTDDWQTENQVALFRWDGSAATEDRLMLDLPWAAIDDVAAICETVCGSESMRAVLKEHLPDRPSLATAKPSDWLQAGISEEAIRTALAKASKEKDWLKRIDAGILCGELVAAHWEAVAPTSLGTTITQVRDWLYDRAGHS